MTKRHKILTAFSILDICVGIILMLTRDELNYIFGLSRVFGLFLVAFFIFSGVVTLIYVFLQGGFISSQLTSNENIDEQKVKSFLNDFTDDFVKKLEANEKVNLNEEQILSLVEKRISEVTNQTILQQIEKEYGEGISDKLKTEEIRKDTYELKYRLEREANKLSRNSSINLSIGVLTTSFAIGILGYSLLSFHPVAGLSASDYMMSLAPRLSLSVFIEIFSFFFLRLYKNNLEDIKYLNNEKTNVDLKLIALKTSILYKDKDLTKEICVELSKTERNFKLKRGETTVEIQKSKLDNSFFNKTVENIATLLKKN